MYMFDRAFSTLKNCADHLFEYFEILLFLRLTYGISRGKKQHFRHLLFFAFHQGLKAAEAAQDICMVYGEGVIGKYMARKWFVKFKNGNFDIDDMPCSRRPSEFDKNHLKALLKEESGGGGSDGFTSPIPGDGGADQLCGVSVIGQLSMDGTRGPEVRGNCRIWPDTDGPIQGSLARSEKGPVIQNHSCCKKESRLDQPCGEKS